MIRKATSAALAAAMLVTAAAPAEAQRWGRDRDRHHRDRGDGIDAGDVIGGLLVVGAVAGIAAALTNKDGYGNAYRGEKGAVDACVREAEQGASRYHPARVTDIDNVEKQGGYYYVTGYMNVAGDGPRGEEVGFSCTARSGKIYDFQRADGYHW